MELQSTVMATLEHRGESIRVNWRLGGGRSGARQSVTFTGSPKARMEWAVAAKKLVEANSHNMTRAECYTAVLGQEPTNSDIPTFTP